MSRLHAVTRPEFATPYGAYLSHSVVDAMLADPCPSTARPDAERVRRARTISPPRGHNHGPSAGPVPPPHCHKDRRGPGDPPGRSTHAAVPLARPGRIRPSPLRGRVDPNAAGW